MTQAFRNQNYGAAPAAPVPGSGPAQFGNVSTTSVSATGAVTTGSGLVTNNVNAATVTALTPAVPAASTNQANNTGQDVWVFLTTTGTGVSVSVTDAASGAIITGMSGARTFFLAAGWIINLGAYTVAPTWAWVPV